MQRPQTLEQVKEATEGFLYHYNVERPNQARSCGNQPPRIACPTFPTLPAVPETIDPDRWLERVSGQVLVRKVQSDASLTINHERYYMPRQLVGQQVTCFLNAPEKQFEIWQAGSRVTSVPIKGLSDRKVPFEEYVCLMRAGSSFGISTVSADPSQAHSRSSVGLSQQESRSGKKGETAPSRAGNL